MSMKEFFFPNNEKSNELDTTTVVVKKDDNKMNNQSNSGKPNIYTPKTFMQVESIANEILTGKSVIVDLNETDIVQAKRICDFLNGVTYALNGKVEKIARLVYLFSPTV